AALAALVRGKVEKSVVGGIPGGRPLIRLAAHPAAITVYVALPPPGTHANTRRYPIAIVGGGYRGILTSRSTRIRGLVSIAGVTRPGLTVGLMAVLTLAASFAGASRARLLPALLCALVVAYLVVLLAWPEVNSLAPIGPHPDGGGRFFGVTNLVETVLLTVSLQAAARLPRGWIPPLALLALVTVGWSRTGADGGGLLVLGCAFAVLGFRLAGTRLTPRVAVASGLAGVG